MRTPSLLLATLTVALSAVARPAPVAAQAPAAPCTTPTAACEQWVTLAGGPARSMVYASYPLGTPNPAIRRALIMVHGTNRNADRYFSSALAAAFLAGALQDTIVISPRIASAAGSCKDTLAPNEVSWSCTGDSWRSGGTAASHPSLTSFDLVDELLRTLAKKSTFPNLRAIVVAGHSAGGQFVTRYQMANKVHETLGVPVSYVVANPSSYSWPDATRPLPVGRRGRREGQRRLGDREAAHGVPVRAVRRGEGAGLQQLASRSRRAQERLHRGDERRAVEEEPGVASGDVSARSG